MPAAPSPQNPGLELNVLGTSLQLCSCRPLTGWTRDGFCRHHDADHGRHTVCAVMTETFLSYSRAQGNDLSTPRPEFSFPGLRPGDAWCVCAARWQQAYWDGVAPGVRLEACAASALEVVNLEHLREHAVSGPAPESSQADPSPGDGAPIPGQEGSAPLDGLG